MRISTFCEVASCTNSTAWNLESVINGEKNNLAFCNKHFDVADIKLKQITRNLKGKDTAMLVRQRRITDDDKYPSVPEILMIAGYEIVELKRIIAEKDGIKRSLEEQIKYVNKKYLHEE